MCPPKTFFQLFLFHPGNPYVQPQREKFKSYGRPTGLCHIDQYENLHLNHSCGTGITRGCAQENEGKHIDLPFNIMDIKLYCIQSDETLAFLTTMLFESPIMEWGSSLLVYEVLMLDGWIDVTVHKRLTLKHLEQPNRLDYINFLFQNKGILSSISEPGRGGEVLVIESPFNESSSDGSSAMIIEVRSTYVGETSSANHHMPYHTLNYICRAKLKNFKPRTIFGISIAGDYHSLKIHLKNTGRPDETVFLKAYWVYDVFMKKELYFENLPKPCKIPQALPFYYKYCLNHTVSATSLEHLLFFSSSQNQNGSSRISWTESLEFCQSVGGMLPIVRSKQEMFELLNLLKTYLVPIEAVFIGLYLSYQVRSSTF